MDISEYFPRIHSQFMSSLSKSYSFSPHLNSSFHKFFEIIIKNYPKVEWEKSQQLRQVLIEQQPQGETVPNISCMIQAFLFN